MTVDWQLRDMSDYALYFVNSEEDYVNIPSLGSEIASADAFTISYSIQYDQLRDFVVPYGSANPVLWTEPYRDGAAGVSVKFDDETGTSHRLETGRVLDEDEEYRVTFTFDRRYLRAYLGTELLGELDTGGVAIASFNDVQLGSWNSGSSSIDGLLDDIHTYGEALDDEIDRLARAEVIEEAALISAYNCDSGTGTTLVDQSGNGYDGTLNGPDWVVDTNPFAIDGRLIDVRVTDAFNRFARSGKAVLDDPDGNARGGYPKGNPVRLEVRRDDLEPGWGNAYGEVYGDGFETVLGGFVFGTGTDRDTIELEILAHDLWLRRRKIFDSYNGVLISDILQDLITQYTPLEWNPGLVSVQNDVAFTRQWQGEALSEAIEELASRSAGEDFGANNNAEFFFRPEETTTASRTFGDGEYYEADFSEEAKREVNRVVLYYGSGSDTGAVAVQDRSSQLQLQDDLGAPRPVVIEKTVNYPEISTQATAESKARKILEGGTAIRTGELKTWEAFDVEPGDVTSVVVPEQDVDGDYRVAEIEYRWQADETRVRLARNSKGVVDVLSSLSDEVTRIDAKGANSNATVNEVVDLAQDIVIDTELEVYTRSVPADQLLFGPLKGGFGDERVGGGRLGDQRGAPTKVI